MTELSEKELFDLETEKQIAQAIRLVKKNRRAEWRKLKRQENAVRENALKQENRIDTAFRSLKTSQVSFSSRISNFLWSIIV
jgi:hypothetical protein